MALCAFRAKLEEHTPGEGDPPAKRPCSQFDQQLSKLPGDLTLVKDPTPKSNVFTTNVGYIKFLKETS